MIKISKKKPETFTGDMVVYFVKQEKKGGPRCENPLVQTMLKRAFKTGDYSGKEGQCFLFYPDYQKKSSLQAKRVLVVGLGKDQLTRETFRKAGGKAASSALQTKAQNIFVVIPEYYDFDISESAECLAEGFILGAYSFRKYKHDDPEAEKPGFIKEVNLFGEKYSAVRKGAYRGEIAAKAAIEARNMANEPGNHWTPSSFADHARHLAKNFGFRCTILEKSDMKRLGMGGVLGVNQGSAQPPKMVIVEHRPISKGKKHPTLLLVGKGLTFDSGGISLKPGSGMEEMKFDMCGGAAVLSVMQAVGEEKIKNVNVIAMVPSTENLPGPAALKPGDIIRHYGGKTVEVINTDAEGRLILADALAYGIKKYKPNFVVDIATLTGAVIIGLGHHRTGLLTNNDELSTKLMAAGERSGEPLWRLPLGPEYRKQLDSQVADLKNVGKRDAGTITAAAFLQEFVGETPWAHLDIAGTAWNFTEKPYVPKGPSAVGVRMLIELIRAWK